MALARALTKRIGKQQDEAPVIDATPNRAYSTRRYAQPIDRSKISLPLELLSSSNSLAYEAPDISAINEAKQGASVISPASSSSSARSWEDSLMSPGLSSSSSITSAEVSRENSPTIAEPNHNTSFFIDKPTKSKSVRDTHHSTKSNTSNFSSTSAKDLESVPNLPSRAPSHTKQTHQNLARERSRTRSTDADSTVSKTLATRSSIDMFTAKPEADHPFGAELAKVNELAEEFGVKEVQILDEETQYLVDHGFGRFSASDYMSEIQPLFSKAFTVVNTWL